MSSNLSLPETGGFFSTDGLIVLGVTVAFIALYVIFCTLRENKHNEMKDFNSDDFVDDDEQTKQ